MQVSACFQVLFGANLPVKQGRGLTSGGPDATLELEMSFQGFHHGHHHHHASSVLAAVSGVAK